MPTMARQRGESCLDTLHLILHHFLVIISEDGSLLLILVHSGEQKKFS